MPDDGRKGFRLNSIGDELQRGTLKHGGRRFGVRSNEAVSV